MRHTKIIATIGPATDADSEVDALLAAGVDVFRINFSHGTRDGHRRMWERVRARAARAGRIVALLQDLAGPKIRIGALADGPSVDIATGATLRIATGEFLGSAERVSTTFAPLASAVSPGDQLMLDDGRIALRVVDSNGSEIVTRVEHGGALGERKGISARGVDFPLSALTERDVADLVYGLTLGVDFVGLSFVQTGDDLRRAREVATRAGVNDVALVAKIERPQAVEHFDDILDAADGVMVARGDLGLEIPLEQVPRVQKDLTRRARAAAVPVIVATEVLDTMRRAPRPTRAEVSDAANAVGDGVDAIMLSGETAVGSYPALAVQTLDEVIRDAERSPPSLVAGGEVGHRHGRALCEAAVTLAATAEASAIVAVTRSGATARQLAALRPHIQIHAVTDQAIVARRLAMVRGVAPVVVSADLLATDALKQELVARRTVAAGEAVAFVRVHDELSLADANFVELQRF